jgi:hypothetical protein
MALDGRTGDRDESRGLAIVGLCLTVVSSLCFWLLIWLFARRETVPDGYTSLEAGIKAAAICALPLVGGFLLALFGVACGLLRQKRWALMLGLAECAMLIAHFLALTIESFWPSLIGSVVVVAGFPLGFYREQRPGLPAIGLCPACSYDTRGLPANARCPECGRAP